MTIAVRRLGLDDWLLWRDVRLAALADAPEAFGSSLAKEQAYTEADWRASMHPARGLKAAATTPDGTAGVIGVWIPDNRDPEVYSMWVHPHSRGTGLGDRLIAEAVAWAREQQLKTLELWVVDGNPAADKLYTRNGFERTGETQPHPSAPGRSEYLMRKVL
ncbi:GNAT family N-acetyltransferase [Dactylosporangium sp. NPDC051541]|uniref:GNAT family N-acetyltransferase n=1 Tax=Dactylosporangium sp. NPDC051541 TaxID=3363977 RepID=UPI0037BC44A4